MLALTNGVLIDGTENDPVKSATVLIEGNRIKAAGANVEIPEGSEVIDLKGKTILPGLIDTHLHAGGTVEMGPGKPAFCGSAGSVDYSDARESALKWGITTWRSGGDYFPDIQETSEKVKAGKLRGPRIFYHGPQIQAVNGHPGSTVWKGDPETCAAAGRFVTNPDEVRATVRELAAAGIPYIKIMMCELDIWQYPKKTPRLSDEIVSACVDEAHKLGCRVTVHCECPRDALVAVKAGTDSAEHIFTAGGEPAEVPDELIPLMVKQKTFVAPTLTYTRRLEKSFPQAPPRFETVRKIIKDMSDAGVRVVVGTDSGAPYIYFGETAHLEMQEMVALGISPKKALLGATRYAAECLGIEDELGTIEVGKLADITVVDGNPLDDISTTMNIAYVIKDGEIIAEHCLSK